MNSNLIKVRFVAAFLFLLYTVAVEIRHAEAADTLLTVALIISVSCLAFALYEVVTSHRISRTQKVLWVSGLLLLNWPALLYYVFVRREQIRNFHQNDIHTTGRRM